MQKNKIKETILIVMTSVLFLLAALNSVTFFKRLDLTENKSFTISDTTKRIIRSIPEQVNITYFISDRIKAISPIPTEIEDLLFEYSAHSNGKIDVASIDPAKTNMTSRAQSMGIIPQQIEVYEKNEQSFATVYSGIAIQYLDNMEIIPFTITLETLEYELTHRIRKLVEDVDITLGVVTGDSRKNAESHYTYLKGRIEQNYNIEFIPPGQEIPPSISVLAVVGNRDLTDGDMLYIDEYIMHGGRVIFCIDGVDVDMTRNLEAVKLEDSPATEMLKKYGIHINNDLVLDKYAKRIPLRGTFPMLYPQWIGITSQNVSKDNPVTSRFSGLDLLWASSIEIKNPVDGLEYERLIASTDQAWTMDDHITASPYEVSAEMSYQGEDQRQLALGYAASGIFKRIYR